MPTKPKRPADYLVREAVSSLRTVGTVFVLVDLLITALAWSSGIHRLDNLLVAGSAGIFLLGPGIVYHLTAFLIFRRDVFVARLSYFTALGQSAFSLLGLPLFLLAGRHNGIGARNDPLIALALPAMLTLFFVPALLVQALHIRRALAIILTQSDSQRGFAVLAVVPLAPPALPLTTDQPPPAPQTFSAAPVPALAPQGPAQPTPPG